MLDFNLTLTFKPTRTANFWLSMGSLPRDAMRTLTEEKVCHQNPIVIISKKTYDH